MEVPKFIRGNSTATVKPRDNKKFFNLLYSNYDARCIRINDLGFVKEYFNRSGYVVAAYLLLRAKV